MKSLVVNRILCPMLNEAIFLYGEGVASATEIDDGMKLGCNHPIGPLALTDMIGLDVLLAVMEVFAADFFAAWGRLAAVRTPLIAAVGGYALGGGCELAMMCDVLIAADTAKFGQPEIKLGVLPGMGGSQRLTRAVGKAKAMDMILTGRTIDAAEAERIGLVSRVVPADDLLTEATAVATTISQMSRSAARMAKEAVNRAFESPLAEGLLYERRLFHSAFATDDQSEGMAAFSEKRPPNFTHR